MARSLHLPDFVGSWMLSGYGRTEPETVDTQRPVEEQNERRTRFLLGTEPGEISSATGLHLHVHDDGRFEQRIEADASDVLVYDVDGVLTRIADERALFSGTLVWSGAHVQLRPEDRRLSSAGPAVRPNFVQTRYNDGDTILCDWIERDGDTLVRTINAITDWAYLDCITLRYARP